MREYPSSRRGLVFYKNKSEVDNITYLLLLLNLLILISFLPVGLNANSNSSISMTPPVMLGCNNPLVGKDVVVDNLQGGLASILSGSGNDETILTNGDLTDYVTIDGLDLVGLGSSPLFSVKDINNDYPAGQRAGYVIEGVGGLLSADVLNDFEIRTYLDNELQETAQISGGGALISLGLLSGSGSKRRVDFLTSLPFDEIELRITGVANLSLLSALRIYYAYEEVDGCDYNCAIALTTTNYPGATATSDCDLFIGTCLSYGFGGFNNTTNADTTDYASATYLLAESNYLDIDIGEDIPANYEVGFALEETGLLGLLTLDLLGQIVITTYDNGILAETFVASNALANVGVLSNGINLISFPTSQAFDQVRVTISSTLSLLPTYRIYYGFVRPDTDGDGWPDCVDKCALGDDNFDADGDGIPDDCDSDCTVYAGADVSACTVATTFSLAAAEVSQSWSPVMGNPSAASIDNSGNITGLATEGIYQFQLSDGSCSDTIAVSYFESSGQLACNDPIAGPGAVINDNGSCSLCGNGDIGNLLDGDLSNFAADGNLLSLSLLGSDTRLVSVLDTFRQYPAGTRAGYVLNFPSGLLSLDLLEAFELRTYNDGVLLETAGNGSSNLLNADVLGSSGQQRLSFTTTQAFDEIELVIQGGLVSLDLLTTIRIYYAFTEPSSCPDINSITDITDICGIPLTASSDYCGSIVYERSGFSGLACVGCTIDSLSNLIDNDLSQAATIDFTASALGDLNLSIATTETISAGSQAGFAVGIESSLLAVGLLDDISITTYLGGVLQESVVASNPLLNVQLFNSSSDINYLSFKTNNDFDEVQITFAANLASVSLGGTINVYYAYIQLDTDNDGTPDCLDKCCSGSDNLDGDGDGLPDACDTPMDAVDDSFTVVENTMTDLDIIINDDFGDNGPSNIAVQIVGLPTNGMVVVNENGTPNDPSDDTIIYTPQAGFAGNDQFSYVIMDANFSADTAVVDILVEAEPLTTLNLKVLLLGALWPDFTGSNLMRDDLRTLGFIPLDEPYGSLGEHFNQLGDQTGFDQTTALVLGANDGTGDAIVDWVFVELRSATDNTVVIRTVPALLQRDGDVVGVAGSALEVGNLPASFYVAIKHRNHLGAMTANPIVVSGQTATVDFTTLTDAEIWNNAGYDGVEMYTLGNGLKALWVGNVNTDNKVKYDGSINDRQGILTEVVMFDGNDDDQLNYDNALGYFQGDCDLNGKAKYDGSGNDRTIIQAAVVTLYDLNTSGVNNYNNMIEQIPVTSN